MPVVINEFEVVPQTQPSNPPAETEQSSGPAPSAGQSPRDVAKILERNHERLLRVWAH